MPAPIWLSSSLVTVPRRMAEITTVSTKLGVRRNEVIGCWARWHFWKGEFPTFDSVAPENVASAPVAMQITPAMIDSLVDLPGFAAALCEIGWLELTATGFVVSSAGARGSYARAMEVKAQRRAADEARQQADRDRKAAEVTQDKAERAASKSATSQSPAASTNGRTTLADIRRGKMAAK